MQTQVLTIEFFPEEGAIIRLLGLVERRGYEVKTINLPLASKNKSSLDIAVIARDAGRDIGVLQRQISRLIGVQRVLTNIKTNETEAQNV